MPNSADLVTDLPADFNVFGQGVDTSMQDLLGGTTGQILSKTSGTNMDFTWINNDQGDITGVTAGNGISVTSPTGPVPTVAIDTAVTVDKTTAQTLTNKTLTSPALTTPTISTATTNGDILYGTGSGALARLGIGSTSQVLTVTAGIPAWATPASGATYSGCMLINSANISISNASQTTLTWDTEEIDVDGYHSTVTNTGRITIPTGKTGKFLVSFQLRYSPSSTGRRIGYIYKNGTTELWSSQVNGTATNDTVFTGTYVISLAAADYLECRTYQNSGGALDVQGPAPYSYFSATYLGA